MPHTLSTWRGLRAWVVLFLFVTALPGCGAGKRTAHVTGKVTYKDRLVTSGAVTFHGEDGRLDSGQIDHEGNYTVAQAPVGAVKVTVVTARARQAPQPGRRLPGGGKSGEHPGTPPEATTTGKPIVLPKKYQDPEQSGLTYTVAPGKQTIDLRLD